MGDVFRPGREPVPDPAHRDRTAPRGEMLRRPAPAV